MSIDAIRTVRDAKAQLERKIRDAVGEFYHATGGMVVVSDVAVVDVYMRTVNDGHPIHAATEVHVTVRLD